MFASFFDSALKTPFSSPLTVANCDTAAISHNEAPSSVIPGREIAAAAGEVVQVGKEFNE